METIITKEQLESMYHDQRLTYQEIADQIGKSVGYIRKRIKCFGIQARPAGGMKGKARSPETVEKIKVKATGRVFSVEWRKNLSIAKTGSRHPRYGKPNSHPKRCWYTCQDGAVVSMRSNWEVALAEYLNANKVEWEYEPRTFTLSDGSAYTPDFYLPATQEWVEVKGWKTDKHMKKIARFLADHPDEKHILADKDYLLKLGIDLKQKFVSTSPKFPCERCGQDFHRIYKTQRFCSRTCRNRHIAKTRLTVSAR